MTNNLLSKICTPLQRCLLATFLVGFKTVLYTHCDYSYYSASWPLAYSWSGERKIKKALQKLNHLFVGEEIKGGK